MVLLTRPAVTTICRIVLTLTLCCLTPDCHAAAGLQESDSPERTAQPSGAPPAATEQDEANATAQDATTVPHQPVAPPETARQQAAVAPFRPAPPRNAFPFLASSDMSLTPNMIGDFFGSSAGTFFILGGRGGTVPSNAGVVGREKVAENSSPIPRDRFFFNYAYFDEVPFIAGGLAVNRFTPGIERTFFDGQASVEVRVPMAATLDSPFRVGSGGGHSYEVGDVTLMLKSVLWSNDTSLLATGLSLTLPTAPDFTVNAPGTTVTVHSESVHLMPYVGGLYAPNDRFFAQTFLQFDFDASGNPVSVNGVRTGTLQDPTFVYFDTAVGYWMHRRRCGRVRGVAPTFELHYSSSLQPGDLVLNPNLTGIGSTARNIDVLNATIGVTVLLQNNATVTAAFATPLGNSADRQFDGEFRLLLNWFFGRSRNARRFIGNRR